MNVNRPEFISEWRRIGFLSALPMQMSNKPLLTPSSALFFTTGMGLASMVLLAAIGTVTIAPVPSAQAQIPPGARTLSQVKVLFVNPSVGNDTNNDGGERAPFQTITQALRVAQPNTVILLSPGTYSAETGEIFPLILKSGVSIQGDISNKGKEIIIEGGGTFISPTFARQTVTIVGANQAGLAGVTVKNPNPRGYGLWIESSSPVVKENTFTGNTHDGISVNGNGAPSIRNNYFYQNGANGITIYGNSRPELRENVFENTGFGISIAQNSAPILVANRIINNRTGVVVQANARPILRSNLIEDNTEDGLVALSQAVPDLGTANEPGSNIIRNNARYDINGSAAKQVIPAFGNTIAQERTTGNVDFSGGTVAVANQPPSNSQQAVNSQPASNNDIPKETTASVSPTPVAEKSPPVTTNLPPQNPSASSSVALRRATTNTSQPTTAANTALPNLTPASVPDNLRNLASRSSPPPAATTAISAPTPSSKKPTTAATTALPNLTPASVADTSRNLPRRSSPPPAATTAISVPTPSNKKPTTAATTALPNLTPASVADTSRNLPRISSPPPAATTANSAPTPSNKKPTTAATTALPNLTPASVADTSRNLPRRSSPPPAATTANSAPARSTTSAAFPTPSSLEGSSIKPTSNSSQRVTQTPARQATRASSTPKAPILPAKPTAVRQSTSSLTPAQTPELVRQSAQPTPSAIDIPVPAPERESENRTRSPVAATLPEVSETYNSVRITSVTPNEDADSDSAAAGNTIEFVAPQPASNREAPVETARRSPSPLPVLQPAPSGETALLPVPGPNIPVGNIGNRRKAPVSADSQPQPRARGSRYRVVVEVESERQQDRLRSLVPDAFRTVSNGRVLMQVGTFSDRYNAEQMMEMLNQEGLKAAIEPMN